ncbi:basic region leucin zipper [Teratosphaeria destructans]|uniref:Basic region leucin zipper n=1 Tax=Teratosphaeria destructans TaxID=418781 RepID=A0A9W7T1T2_9PEZI|nr:basic region leucin zipper [Teratosphaeria destructans]
MPPTFVAPQPGPPDMLHADPRDQYGGGSASAGSDRSPLSGLLKNLSEKKQTKDGQPPKRRGPKPDSKPALTRRQELNRQAQRTHRERKEMYIKALEQEVLRLKETFANSQRERDAIAEENRRLRELLAAHGIQYDFSSAPIKFQREESGYGPSSSGSISGSYAPGSESSSFSPLPQAVAPSMANGLPTNPPPPMQNMAQLPNNRLDYDSIGIDFVLTLERPCMEHMQYLLVRSHNNDNQFFHHPMENCDDSEYEHMSGHALMSTAPPHSHIMEKPSEQYPFQMPDLGTDGLAKLLDLSNRLPFDHYTEITPVMAWTMILRHDRIGELTEQDLKSIKADLSSKVRCYGFGAVLEEFEVQDALVNVFAKKDPLPLLQVTQSVAAQKIAVY